MVLAKAVPPSELLIAGKPESPGMSTHRLNNVTVSAKIRPQGNSGAVRLLVWVSKTSDFSSQRLVASDWGGARRASVTLSNLSENTRYYIRVVTDQRNIAANSAPNNANFWTERTPFAPALMSPGDNVTVVEGENLNIRWNHVDADSNPADPQSRAQVQWRVAPGPGEPGTDWTTATVVGTTETYNIPASALRVNAFNDWRVRTRDTHSSFWSPWSLPRSVFVLGTNSPPRLEYPSNYEAVPVDVDVTFEWTFRDPSGDSQEKADLRYRVEGTEEWIEVIGDTSVPGASDTWTFPPGNFQPGFAYEWQVRTYDDSGSGVPSSWSTSAFFRAIPTPGLAGAAQQWLGPTTVQGALGSGEYRVYAYDQGGERMRGEITGIATLTWNRLRDDISSCQFTTAGFDDDCCALLSELRSWAHEIVLFRNGERVWEGPITRITHTVDGVEIEARDVLAYVYRRIMRQGYNDNHRIYKGKQVGVRTVVDRAALIIANALAFHDPNVLPWLTRFDFTDDAREARSVPDWQKTAWEEVDNLAATGGLDYTTSGRRIILHDTHRPIGLIGEMRSEHFFSPPVLTEYGMSAANVFGVTNNAGLYGSYSYPKSQWGGIGPIELLASEYGEATTSGSLDTMTPAQIAARREDLNTQAKRNASGRWPSPLVVRVPDNSRIQPHAQVGINQLIPGIYIPLRVQTRCIEMAQIQKLDSVTVIAEDEDEKVQVVMSPAPGEEIDPDSDGVGEEG